MGKSVTIKKSTNPDKRLMAIFKEDGKQVKTVHFGSGKPTGKGAYPDHKDDEIKKAWLARHKVKGTFDKPMTASSLSRWILWNKTSVRESVKDFKSKFGYS